MSTAGEVADQAAAQVSSWCGGAAAALNDSKLSPVDRARLGDLILSAAKWLDERAVRISKAQADAKFKAFRDSIAHLPPHERVQRMAQGR